jgi:hypothetical protein
MGRKQTSEQQLSRQRRLGRGEHNYFLHLQTKDLKRFTSLWDDTFLGWSDYDLFEPGANTSNVSPEFAEDNERFWFLP